MTDLSHFALDLALETKAFITSYVTKALVGITDRFTALEDQLAAVKALVAPGPAGERGETGPEGPPGRDGQNADHDAIMAEVTAAIALLRTDVMAAMREDVTKMFSALRMPADGRDGRDADMTAIKAMVDASMLTQRQPLLNVDGIVSTAVVQLLPTIHDLVQREVSKIAARDGVDGKDGTSVTLDEVRPFLTAEVDAVVRRTVAALPPAKDGVNGKDGTQFLTGIGPPVFESRIGDVYLDTKTGDIYQCR